MDPALPVNIQALLAIIVIGVLTPYVVAFATKPSSSPVLKSVLSGVVTGAGAVTTYLIDLDGVPDWEHALGVFLLAVATAAAYRTNLEPGIEPEIQENYGLRDRP